MKYINSLATFLSIQSSNLECRAKPKNKGTFVFKLICIVFCIDFIFLFGLFVNVNKLKIVEINYKISVSEIPSAAFCFYSCYRKPYLTQITRNNQFEKEYKN